MDTNLSNCSRAKCSSDSTLIPFSSGDECTPIIGEAVRVEQDESALKVTSSMKHEIAPVASFDRACLSEVPVAEGRGSSNCCEARNNESKGYEKDNKNELTVVADASNKITSASKCNDESTVAVTADSFYPSVVQRYFTSYFNVSLASGKTDSPVIPHRNDVRILFHSNKICVITLAPSHAVLKTNATVKSVSFKVSDKCDRFHNKVSGKRKRGAQWLNPESPLCIVTTNDDAVYTIRPGIRGNLIEVNENLLKFPNLISDMPESNGYIAIIMIKLHEKDKILEGLMNEKNYHEYVKGLELERNLPSE